MVLLTKVTIFATNTIWKWLSLMPGAWSCLITRNYWISNFSRIPTKIHSPLSNLIFFKQKKIYSCGLILERVILNKALKTEVHSPLYELYIYIYMYITGRNLPVQISWSYIFEVILHFKNYEWCKINATRFNLFKHKHPIDRTERQEDMNIAHI